MTFTDINAMPIAIINTERSNVSAIFANFAVLISTFRCKDSAKRIKSKKRSKQFTK